MSSSTGHLERLARGYRLGQITAEELAEAVRIHALIQKLRKDAR